MPTPTMSAPIPCDFGDIMQAIETKMLTDAVLTDVSQITWAVDDDVPQLNTQLDILLRARGAQWAEQDGGGWDLRFKRLVEVRIRTQAISDPAANNKTWVKSQFSLEDRIINSVGNAAFSPLDANGNNLTTSPIKPISDTGPVRARTGTVFGYCVVNLEVNYLPLVTLPTIAS